MSFIARFWTARINLDSKVLVEEPFDSLAAAYSWLDTSITSHPGSTGDGELLHIDDQRHERVVVRFREGKPLNP